MLSIKTEHAGFTKKKCILIKPRFEINKGGGTASPVSQGVCDALKHAKSKRGSYKQQIKLSPQRSCAADLKTPRSIFLYYTAINRERGQELHSSAPRSLLISFRIIVLAHKLHSLTVLLAIKEPYMALKALHPPGYYSIIQFLHMCLNKSLSQSEMPRRLAANFH